MKNIEKKYKIKIDILDWSNFFLLSIISKIGYKSNSSIRKKQRKIRMLSKIII